MNTLPLVLMAVSLLSFQARAQEFAPQGVSEDMVADRDLDSGLKDNAIEISAQTFGDFGSNAVSNFATDSNHSTSQYRSTDGLLSATFRHQLSSDWDVAATVPLYSHVAVGASNQLEDNRISQILLYPVSLGMRYHFSVLSDTVRPFLQADLGEAIISEKSVYAYDGTDFSSNDSSVYVRPFARVTAGANFYFSPRSTIYVGVKAGYLAMSEYGSLVTGLDVGYAF